MIRTNEFITEGYAEKVKKGRAIVTYDSTISNDPYAKLHHQGVYNIISVKRAFGTLCYAETDSGLIIGIRLDCLLNVKSLYMK